MSIINFLKGNQPCWECGGTGQSPRGYGDTSPCGTCRETGILKIHRLDILRRFILKIWFRFLKK